MDDDDDDDDDDEIELVSNRHSSSSSPPNDTPVSQVTCPHSTPISNNSPPTKAPPKLCDISTPDSASTNLPSISSAASAQPVMTTTVTPSLLGETMTVTGSE